MRHSKDSTATILLSGGIDSAACAHHLLQQDENVHALFIDYGQPALTPESRAAAALANHLSIPLTTLSITGLPIFGTGELLGRNLFLVATALLSSRPPVKLLSLGIHHGTAYYDCSEHFFDLLSRLISEHSDGTLVLSAPFLAWSKFDIFRYFLTNNLPLDLTYSCETGSEPPCNVCKSCLDRLALRC